MSIELEKVLALEYNNIIENKWGFLKNTYKSNIKKPYSRSKIGNYLGIQKIKLELYNLLGAIPIFMFLTEICSYIRMPAPIFNIEKGILLLKLMIDGCSINHMKIYDENDSFYKIYESVFITNADFLESFCDDMLINSFSTSSTRLLYSKIHNPTNFEHCTLLLDGRHNKITVEDIELNKKDLYSYKLKKNAFNTQYIIDSAGYLVYVSESLPCKFNNDDNMFINNINLTKFFKLSDCMCFDGLYENVVQEVITKYNNIGLDINVNNFCFPIKKDKNIDLEIDEANFNNQLGSYRSGIETFFASFCNTFKRFGPKANVRITKERTYNIQLKLCLTLFNIKNFVEKNKIEEKSYYKLWMEESFDFFNDSNDFTIIKNTSKTKYKKDNIINMQSLQNDMITKLVSEINLNVNKNKENMDIDESITKKRKEKSYEIQYIYQHRQNKNIMEYLVKWRGYSKSESSWVSENDFDSKEIIDSYWNTL